MKNWFYDHRFSEQSEKAAGEENKGMAAAEIDKHRENCIIGSSSSEYTKKEDLG